MQTVSASDLALVRRILNATYTAREGKQANSIHCTSRTGMRIKGDADDDEQWAYVLAAFRRHLGERLLEVFENVCAWHSDFTIYLKATPFEYLDFGEPLPKITPCPSGRNDCPSGCEKCPPYTGNKAN